MEQQAEQPAIQVDSLGATLRGRFELWKQARQQKEMEWLDSLRAFNGQYTSEELAIINDPSREGLSKIYVGLTRMKVTAAYSRITELLFQPGNDIGITTIAKPRYDTIYGCQEASNA